MKASPIDQEKRKALCLRIVAMDEVDALAAAKELANLYRGAGLNTLARVIETAGLPGARRHALSVIGRPLIDILGDGE